MARVLIDPLNRIEGHLSIDIEVEGGKVVEARTRGDMYRGFENLLRGRNPVDANMITQRICGVCPISHAIASSKCLESAFAMEPTINGTLIRNLVLAANFFQSHIIHFYHLSALDYVDVTAILQYKGKDEELLKLRDWAKKDMEKKGTPARMTAVSPFLPRYEGKDFYIADKGINIELLSHYLRALDIRRKTHRMATLFAGKIPHAASLLPGGVSQTVTNDRLDQFQQLLDEVDTFVNDVYLKDIMDMAKLFPDYLNLGRYEDFLAYGAFETRGMPGSLVLSGGVMDNGVIAPVDLDEISEHVKYSRFKDTGPLHPSRGVTEPDPEKKNAYTWVKAPRYRNKPFEVGPLARVAINYEKGSKAVRPLVDRMMTNLGGDVTALYSALGRHACRAMECSILVNQSRAWLELVKTDEANRSRYEIPEQGEGYGLTEAPRGALGHWIEIEEQKIKNYQCVVPTTWNVGPRDNAGTAGVIEQSLLGTPVKDTKNPIEPARIVRSFDPCLACAIHVMEGGETLRSFRIS
jgi:ferredoxin hydrogenase large subunit/hydrogenase large subunit